MALKITPGNTDDRAALKEIVRTLSGKCYADRGYIGQNLFQSLWKKGLHLITGIRKNMKSYLIPHIDKVLLRKQFIIETTFGVLKTSWGWSTPATDPLIMLSFTSFTFLNIIGVL